MALKPTKAMEEIPVKGNWWREKATMGSVLG